MTPLTRAALSRFAVSGIASKDKRVEILSIGLLILAVVLAYLLYRQQQLFSAAQQSVLERDRSLQAMQQDMTGRDARLEEKKSELERLETQLRELRQTIANNEGSVSQQEQKQAEHDRVIVELREQIETSERASRESQALFQTI